MSKIVEHRQIQLDLNPFLLFYDGKSNRLTIRHRSGDEITVEASLFTIQRLYMAIKDFGTHFFGKDFKIPAFGEENHDDPMLIESEEEDHD